MASNSREARRRKILERGSDRLAFITGQIGGVPPPDPTDRETGLTSQQENISDASMLDNMENSIIHQSRAESLQPRKHTETLAEASTSDPRDTTLEPSPAATSSAQTPSVVDLGASQAFTPLVSLVNAIVIQTPSVVDLGASQAFTPLVSLVNAITPNHIGAAIDASEYARMFSALVIALLVILSHLGFSSLGNIVSFRPVFLLLLTDATIVFGRVLLRHHGDPSSAPRQEDTGTVMNGQGIADQIGNALETVMMMKKIMNAISMDFSLYAVILICGLLCTRSIFA